jgi:hypothetical protein
MKKSVYLLSVFIITIALMFSGCGKKVYKEGTFGYDLEFLKKYDSNLVILKDESGHAALIVSPKFQGRVMTSTAAGDDGNSFGWINYSLIQSGEILQHMNPVGGEDRFWIGPEGGQFSVFFAKGDSFKMEKWFTPACVDIEAFDVVEKTNNSASFVKTASIKNYSDAKFDIKIERKVSILSKQDIESKLNIKLTDSISYVGYQTENKLINTGVNEWKKDSGLLSIWILGMFRATPSNIVVLPYKQTTDTVNIVNDAYFNKVPAERLKITKNAIFFKADGEFRGKIGLPPSRIKTNIAASYDLDKKVLTVVQYSFDSTKTEYVNSLWKWQENPYGGDVLNSYNDGPNELGSRLGQFYEIETSSPAIAAKPNEGQQHISCTYHFQGSENQLNTLSLTLLGVSIDEIKNIFK